MHPTRHRILFVERNADICAVMRLLLERANCEVVSTDSLSEGLGLAMGERFDLYLVSYLLTEGTGVELCHMLREFDARTPILFWSALVYEADREQAMRAGADVFLKQPDDLSIIPETIDQLICGARNSHTSSAHCIA